MPVPLYLAKAEFFRTLGTPFDELAHERPVFDSTPAAIAHARQHAARVGHTSD